MCFTVYDYIIQYVNEKYNVDKTFAIGFGVTSTYWAYTKHVNT